MHLSARGFRLFHAFRRGHSGDFPPCGRHHFPRGPGSLDADAAVGIPGDQHIACLHRLSGMTQAIAAEDITGEDIPIPAGHNIRHPCLPCCRFRFPLADGNDGTASVSIDSRPAQFRHGFQQGILHPFTPYLFPGSAERNAAVSRFLQNQVCGNRCVSLYLNNADPAGDIPGQRQQKQQAKHQHRPMHHALQIPVKTLAAFHMEGISPAFCHGCDFSMVSAQCGQTHRQFIYHLHVMQSNPGGVDPGQGCGDICPCQPQAYFSRQIPKQPHQHFLPSWMLSMRPQITNCWRDICRSSKPHPVTQSHP